MASRTCLRLCIVAALLWVGAADFPQYNSQYAAGIFQSANNYASGNAGPVNQQSSNQAIQQKGNNNQASQYNNQQIVGCDASGVNQQASNQAVQQKGNGNGAGNGNIQGISGRRLSGSVSASASSSSIAGQGINQQASNSAIKETGNGGQASTATTGTINCGGRRLLNA